MFQNQKKNRLTFYVERKKVAGKAVSGVCESGCNFWFHRVCTGLMEFAFHQLTQEVYAKWVCDTCIPNFSSLSSFSQSLEPRKNNLNNRGSVNNWLLL